VQLTIEIPDAIVAALAPLTTDIPAWLTDNAGRVAQSALRAQIAAVLRDAAEAQAGELAAQITVAAA